MLLSKYICGKSRLTIKNFLLLVSEKIILKFACENGFGIFISKLIKIRTRVSNIHVLFGSLLYRCYGEEIGSFLGFSKLFLLLTKFRNTLYSIYNIIPVCRLITTFYSVSNNNNTYIVQFYI